jgi:hypothetical protein
MGVGVPAIGTSGRTPGFVATATAFALLLELAAPLSMIAQVNPEELSPVQVLRYRELACRSFASVSNGDRTVAALAVSGDGLLLVPAHLLSLATEVRVNATLTDPRANRTDQVTVCSLDSVTVVGIHPRLDLALIQVRMPDPRLRFHPVDFARNGIANRDWVYLSNPFQPLPRKRRALTTSVGEKEGYFRLEQEGKDETRDLGLFVFDEEARAVGLVSWVPEGGEVVARALTLAGLRREDFISAAECRFDPARKESLIRMAEKLLRPAGLGFRDPLDDARAHFLIELGLVNDPGDIETYLRVAQPALTRAMSVTLLARAISLDPWSVRVKAAYLDLGNEFARSFQMAEAETVWLELTAKYPTECAAGWVALARSHAAETKYREAAFEARMALHTNSDRREEMVRLYRFGLDQLDAVERDKLEARIREIEPYSDKARSAAAKSRTAGKRFMTIAAEELFNTPAPLGSRPQATPSRKPATPHPVEVDPTPAYVAARIRVAAEYLKSGQGDAAESILEDVLRECPKDPQIGEARRLLAVLHGH